MDKINTINHKNFLDNTLPDKCAQLIIADPPYFEVKGEFDFIWKSFDDYLKDVEKWAVECKRLLADNGTLFWYGDSKKIAYSQIILDKYLRLLSSITVNIVDRKSRVLRVEDARTFLNCKEMLLMYDPCFFYKDFNKRIEFNNSLKRVINMKPIISYLNGARLKKGLTLSKINKLTSTRMADVWFNHRTQWQLPTMEAYNKLVQIIGNEFLYKEYSEIKLEFEKISDDLKKNNRFFEPLEKFKMNVLNFSQEGMITSNFDHDTVKPEKLTRILVKTCSRPDDLVIVPFAGSGTECAMSILEGRRFYGYEIEEKYVNISNKRVKEILRKPQLF